MDSVERELKSRGKWLGFPCFALALGLSAVGLFTHGPLDWAFGLPRWAVPLLVMLALGCGVASILLSLGTQRCRRCKTPLVEVRTQLHVGTAGLVRSALVEGNPKKLLSQAGAAAGPPTDTAWLQLELRYCPSCKSSGTVEARLEPEGQSAYDKQSLVGPVVREWLALFD